MTTRPTYLRPTIRALDEKDLLTAFQMTAAEISAAGCWWSPTSAHPGPPDVGP
jgi:hypothetical protein